MGIFLALKLIPASVMAECRDEAQAQLGPDGPKNWFAAAVIVILWLALAALAIALVARTIKG